MAWFNRKAAASSPRPALVRSVSQGWGGARGDWPRDYLRQLADGYLGNAVAQRSVRLVAESAGSVPVYQPGDDQRVARLIGRGAGGQRLVETAAMYLLLHGNAFLQVALGGDGMPAMLYPLVSGRLSFAG